MFSTRLLCLLVLLGVSLAPHADAATRGHSGLASGGWHQPLDQGAHPLAEERVSLDQAAAMVRRQTNGRIIKASTRRSNGRAIHHIRVLTRDGKVFTVRVDATSGRRL